MRLILSFIVFQIQYSWFKFFTKKNTPKPIEFMNKKELNYYFSNSLKDRIIKNRIIKQLTCKHLFDPKDMQNRDINGNVKWKCCKCNKEFMGECGLDILKNGDCTGKWGVN